MTTDNLKARVEQAILDPRSQPDWPTLVADLWAEVERLCAAVADNHKAIDYYGDVAERVEAERSDARDALLRMIAERDTALAEVEAMRTASLRTNGWRQVEEACSSCGGRGRRVYGSTSTWRGGIGGQSMTEGVCSDCWGTGDTANPGPDLRASAGAWRVLEAERDELRRLCLDASARLDDLGTSDDNTLIARLRAVEGTK